MSNLVINLYSMALLGIIYFQSLKQVEKESLQYKIYMLIIKMTALLIIMDIFSRFDSKSETIYYVLNYIGNYMLFTCNLVIPSLWLLYVYIQAQQDESKIRHISIVLIAINAVNAGMVLVAQFFGWFFYIDSANIYHRGSLFWIPVVITIILVVFTYVFIVKNRDKIEKKHCLTLAFFAACPFIGIFVQVAFYGISLIMNCLVFSLLLVYLNIQNNNLYTDYLTGVYNRKKFDMYLRNKINSCTDGKTFSAIMLDLNNFKNINDTWGHDVGDKALIMAIKLLVSCLRVEDFVARYGGDEFCIVLDITNKSKLEEIVQRINNCFNKYNTISNLPYELSFSIGYSLYDSHSGMKMEDFIIQLDMLMYENKQNRKYEVYEM